MTNDTLTTQQLEQFTIYLLEEEKSAATIEKYSRALRIFYAHLGGGPVTKERIIQYKQELARRYSTSSVNGALAAINGLMVFLGRQELQVKPLKQQKKIFRDKSRELTRAEYLRLLAAAKARGDDRLYYLMETLSATGIRVSELRFITVEAVASGQAVVDCKGKRRLVLLPGKLRRALRGYCREAGITAGPVFVTRRGRPLDRSNVWRDLKRLCAEAGVDSSKVFPHNFRHLFAVEFYRMAKDIAKLADLLGHASIETTRIYVMESAAAHIRQVERLGLVV